MTEQNYKFIDIVFGLFLLIILAGNYLGLLYITEGNIGISFLLSIGLMVYYYFVIDQLCKNKQEMADNGLKHPSVILWVVFLFMFFISFLLMSHFINVEYNAKKNIQEEAKHKINLVSNALDEYNVYFEKDSTKFENDLSALINSYITDPNYRNTAKSKLLLKPFNLTSEVLSTLSSSTEDTIKKTYLHAYNLMNSNVHRQINNNIDSTNNSMLNSFLNWNRLNINDKYGQLNFYVKQSIKSLNDSKNNFAGTYPKIKTPALNNVLPINNPFKLKEKYQPSPLVPIIVLLLTHIFLLIPFYFKEYKIYTNKNRDSGTGKNVKSQEMNISESSADKKGGVIEL